MIVPVDAWLRIIRIRLLFHQHAEYSLLYFHSKLQSEALREAIAVITADAKEKKRNFTETVELQIGLKNYDPQKDKRFSGSVKLPHIPRPKMKICMLGDAQHVEEVSCWKSNYIIHSSNECHLQFISCCKLIVIVNNPTLS